MAFKLMTISTAALLSVAAVAAPAGEASAGTTVSPIISAWRENIPLNSGVCPSPSTRKYIWPMGEVSVSPDAHNTGGWTKYDVSETPEGGQTATWYYQTGADRAQKVAHCLGYGNGYYEYTPTNLVHRVTSSASVCIPIANKKGDNANFCALNYHGAVSNWRPGAFATVKGG